MIMIIFIIILSFFSPPSPRPLSRLAGTAVSLLGRSMAGGDPGGGGVGSSARSLWSHRNPRGAFPPLLPHVPFGWALWGWAGGQGPAPLAAVLLGGRKRSVEAEEVPEPR